MVSISGNTANNIIFLVDEGGIAEQRLVYELPLELFQKVKLQKFLEQVVERRLNLEHLLAGTKKWDY